MQPEAQRFMQDKGQAYAQIDTLAQQLSLWVAPIRFALAQNDAERESVYRLRYQAVIEHRWLAPAALAGGLECDAYDARAIHIVAWDGVTLAATSRVVLPAPGLPLPTEAAFDLCIEPLGKVADAGRFVVARAYSNMEHRLLAALVARTWLEVRGYGYSDVCAAFASPAMIRLYNRMNLRVTPLAPPRLYWGQERYPVRFDAALAASGVIAQWLDKIERDHAAQPRRG